MIDATLRCCVIHALLEAILQILKFGVAAAHSRDRAPLLRHDHCDHARCPHTRDMSRQAHPRPIATCIRILSGRLSQCSAHQWMRRDRGGKPQRRPSPVAEPQPWLRLFAAAVPCEMAQHAESAGGGVGEGEGLTSVMLGLHGPEQCLKALAGRHNISAKSTHGAAHFALSANRVVSLKPLTQATAFCPERGIHPPRRVRPSRLVPFRICISFSTSCSGTAVSASP